MKTLRDYIKGYGFVPIILICEYKHGNTRYQLCMQDGYGSYYFMKDDEVIKQEYHSTNSLRKLMIQHANHPKDESINIQIKEDELFKSFQRFILEQTGENYCIKE